MSLRDLGEPRTKEWTLSHQAGLTKNPPSQADCPLKCQGVKADKSRNPFLHIPHVDPHVDSTLDALHLGPLGLAKMVAEHLIGSKSHQDYVITASQFLDSIDWSPLHIPVKGSVLIHHWGSFVGRDFKVFIQVAPAVARALGPRAPRYAVKLSLNFAGYCKLMYCSTGAPIDLLVYRQGLKEWGDHFFDLYESEPRLKAYLDEKIKPHYIAHSPGFIDLYGIFNLYATETCEGLNKGIRRALVVSNRKETSFSVASNFSARMGIKYIKGGGLWLGPNGQTVHRAGEEVLRLLKDSGDSSKSSISHGMLYGAMQRESFHRRQISEVARINWPHTITVTSLADNVAEAGSWSHHPDDRAAFGSHFVQSFSICYDQRSDPTSLGWFVIYKTSKPTGGTPITRRVQLIKLLQFVARKDDADTVIGRCFAFISRYAYRTMELTDGRETLSSDNFFELDSLSGAQLRTLIQIDEFSCIKMWHNHEVIDVVPTRNMIQSFGVFHQCTQQCGVAVGTDKWSCHDDGRYSINHFGFTEPLPLVLPPSSVAAQPTPRRARPSSECCFTFDDFTRASVCESCLSVFGA